MDSEGLILNSSSESNQNLFQNSGLYILDRSGKVVRVLIPENMLAFQTGEGLQLLSNGKLIGTPHCVRGVRPGSQVSRNTFAVFLQPNLWEPLTSDLESKSFGDFYLEVMKRHYK